MSPNDQSPVVGQRYSSEAEPELGLGAIAAVDARAVTVLFSASDEVRRYALSSAPLCRAVFNVGERIHAEDGTEFVVDRVEHASGLLIYHGGGHSLCEVELSGRTHFTTPEARLLSGRVESATAFDVRLAALDLRHRARSSPVRGFVGGRIDLIPHQMYIAHEVVSRYAPRVLLADEVGLGKTIEACLVLHRLLVSGRIDRALVLVPESLLHQWLVELRRRFNLRFSLFDEERCQAIELERPDDNPFADDQLILASIEFLASHPLRAKQATAAEWDMLVVDEAHHLRWRPSGASDEYAVVESLAAEAEGLLLLTGTPEQLGMHGHFARLRLLDPSRYPSLNPFLEEAEHYQKVAAIADRLRGGAPLPESVGRELSKLFAASSADMEHVITAALEGDHPARERLLSDLLDRNGVGRVLFRNTRTTIEGFPERRAHLTPLRTPDFDPVADDDLSNDLSNDPRIAWLAELLTELDDEKLLLICRSEALAIAIDDALQKTMRVRSALFHEGLTLVQRDRNAAYLSDPRGARLLICSEIGSEGRNFQFVHHLVLFDLPVDPDLLEQRIGRLDRIGQTHTIHLHVPFVEGTTHEVFATWHHRGLDALEHTLRGGHHLLELLGDRATRLAERFSGTKTDREELESLVEDSRLTRAEVDRKLQEGHDHLLELSSFRSDVADSIVSQVRAVDDAPDLAALSLQLFEHLGIYAEDLGHALHRLNPEGLSHDDFPELDRGDVAITFDRQRALEREDVQFISWDHPLLVRAIELILGDTVGNSALTRLEGAPTPFAVETVFVLECISPLSAHLDRFLPPTPLRVIVDAKLGDATESYASVLAAGPLVDAPDRQHLLAESTLRDELLPAMIARTRELAETRARAVVDAATAAARATLGGEVRRLRALREVNRNVRDDELERAEALLASAVEHLGAASVRIDALRVILG